MGCDIHMYLEMKDKGEWKSLDLYKSNWDYDEKSEYVEDRKQFTVKHIFSDRNYTFFGILAGVRSNEFDPIAYPRGLPAEMNELIKTEYEVWKDDAHSFSWLTLGELKKYYYSLVEDVFDESNEMYDLFSRSSFSILKRLIDDIEMRIPMFKYIWYENMTDLSDKVKKYEDDVRIVFWFDS